MCKYTHVEGNINQHDMSIFMPCSDDVHVCTCRYVVMFS